MESLRNLINKNDTDGIVAFMTANNLKLEGNKIVPNSSKSQTEMVKIRDFYDQRQLIKKILLNS